jgi:broad specificity phosphatase PhoE
MAEITVVHLLRHGEVHNPNHVLYGRLPDYHLSANGRMMAAAAADYFDGRPIVAVFASPLERAQETAQPVAERLGLPITTDERLIESGNVLEGKSVSLASLAVNPLNWKYLWNPFTPSWGEPYGEVVARVRQVIDRARDAGKHPWHNPNSRECDLGSVTSLTFDGTELTGVSYAVPPRRPVTDSDRAQ